MASFNTKRRFLQWCVLVLLGTVAAEGLAFVGLRFLLPNLAETREMLLRSEGEQPLFLYSISQPYLLYSLAPRLRRFGHNEHGYRGKAVPFVKSPGRIRILFLGGSTVYGWGVRRAEETWPSQLGELLNAEKRGTEVEIMNAGLPAGTSAEYFTHYHFKYSYYRPDIVVIEAGGNDANISSAPFYHADYSNRRQVLRPPIQLSPFGKALLSSRLLSLALIPTLQGVRPETLTVDRPPSPPPISWYPEIPRESEQEELRATSVAYQRNIRALIMEAKNDGADVILLPFIRDPTQTEVPEIEKRVAYNVSLLPGIAKDMNVTFLPMDGRPISRENWLDYCHLNPSGNLERAQYLLPEFRKAVSARAAHRSGTDGSHE